MMKLMEVDPFSRILCCAPCCTVKLLCLIKYPPRLPQICVLGQHGVAPPSLERTSLYWKSRSCHLIKDKSS